MIDLVVARGALNSDYGAGVTGCVGLVCAGREPYMI